MTLRNVLIANRGEIAVRIVRACAKYGCRSVAVYSDADRDALHVRLADEAVGIGAAPATESYLSIARLLDAARATGADAIHPGYGFLSERAEFAQAVVDAGLVFIGPDAASIAAMGDKAAAKRRMIAAGVPCVPGYDGDDQSDAALAGAALRIGLPVMIKAVAGGGGRGMRRVDDAGQLVASFASARVEATSAFGDGRLLIERAVVDAWHVEVQVFGDCHGNVIHLGERDCSVQRRHQKLVEEGPSPALTDALRRRIGDAAVAAARAVDYVGAGTVEFLLARDGQFYFLEMNTRLQVEHPVTELVYGVDLVDWQLRIASGERLPLTQDDALARRSGHAIEVRLCAEDPARGFLPQTGTVLAWQPPAGDGVRVDHGLSVGQRIGAHYDSMVAKIIAHGATRADARRRLVAALEGTVLLGVANNRDYLRRVLLHDVFAAGDADTGFVEKHAVPVASITTPRDHATAALALYDDDARRLAASVALPSALIGWNNTATPLALEHDGAIVHATCDASRTVVLGDGSTHRFDANVDAPIAIARHGDELWLAFADRTLQWRDVTYAPARRAEATSDGRVVAPIDGRVVAVLVAPGAAVRKGDVLVIVEAMKMEFRVAAGGDGVVATVLCAPGAQVRARQVLATIVA